METEVLTIREAADYLRVNPRTIRNAIKKNLIPFLNPKICRDVRVRKSDLDKLFE